MGDLVDWVNKYCQQNFGQKKADDYRYVFFLLPYLQWCLFTLPAAFAFNLCKGYFHAFAQLPPLNAGQSLGFYQDEFAGRVSAKVMQTALSVRDVIMTCADMLVYVLVYFTTLRDFITT